ncbi:hypothetical protein L1887_17811 [Cichorium endivia]|nr:hypothetical protein L1887_17811 [Cichorium endivia]
MAGMTSTTGKINQSQLTLDVYRKHEVKENSTVMRAFNRKTQQQKAGSGFCCSLGGQSRTMAEEERIEIPLHFATSSGREVASEVADLRCRSSVQKIFIFHKIATSSGYQVAAQVAIFHC